MKTKLQTIAVTLALIGAALMVTTPAESAPPRPQGPCDIYASAGNPCVAAHSTTRALYATYNGPLYQIMRQSDGKSLDNSCLIQDEPEKGIGFSHKMSLKGRGRDAGD